MSMSFASWRTAAISKSLEGTPVRHEVIEVEPAYYTPFKHYTVVPRYSTIAAVAIPPSMRAPSPLDAAFAPRSNTSSSSDPSPLDAAFAPRSYNSNNGPSPLDAAFGSASAPYVDRVSAAKYSNSANIHAVTSSLFDRHGSTALGDLIARLRKPEEDMLRKAYGR